MKATNAKPDRGTRLANYLRKLEKEARKDGQNDQADEFKKLAQRAYWNLALVG